MRPTSILAALIFVLSTSCTKEDNTYITNNTITNDAIPAYVVRGLHDITFTNGFSYPAALELTVEYRDSAQQGISLSLSDLPEGIELDSNWISSGTPTFNTRLLFSNNTALTKPGIYPITLTATNDSGQRKLFHFNIKVNAFPSYLMGAYNDCRKYCTPGGGPFKDSLYQDPLIPNKIWFTNFGNWGNLVYGYVTGSGDLTIPEQVSGGMTYKHSGDFYINRHINMGLGSSCAMDMF